MLLNRQRTLKSEVLVPVSVGHLEVNLVHGLRAYEPVSK